MLTGCVDKIVLLDVLPLSLKVETQGGIAAGIIPRNSPLPAAESRIFTNAAEFQTSMDIHVLQGESELAADNISLGELKLEGIPATRRGANRVEVTFDVDVDGIVHVSAMDLFSEEKVEARITSTKLLDPWEINDLALAAERKRDVEEAEKMRILAVIGAENVIALAEQALLDQPDLADGILFHQIFSGISETRVAISIGFTEDIRCCSKKLIALSKSAAKCKEEIGCKVS
jgi:molecular chaperone DnaK